MSTTQLDLYAQDLPAHADAVAQYTAAGLTPETAQSLEDRAARILSIGRRSVIEIGQELLAAREQAQYGTWTPFLERCGLGERTAQNYMQVAREFADKPAIIAALPPTALYALAAPSADPNVVGEIIAEVEAGAQPTVAEVQRRLAPERPPLPIPQPAPTPQPLPLATTPLELAIEGQDPRVDHVPAAPAASVSFTSAPAPARLSPVVPAPAAVPQPAPVVPQPLQLPPAPVVDRERQVVELYALAALLDVVARNVMKEANRRYLVLEGTDRAMTVCRDGTTTLTLHESSVLQAADHFLQSPGVKGAVAMLAMQVRVEKPAEVDA